MDKEPGNKEGFAEGFGFKMPARGITMHVYALFEPSIKGLSLLFMLNAFFCKVELM